MKYGWAVVVVPATTEPSALTPLGERLAPSG
jgi:hypothetical protein